MDKTVPFQIDLDGLREREFVELIHVCKSVYAEYRNALKQTTQRFDSDELGEFEESEELPLN